MHNKKVLTVLSALSIIGLVGFLVLIQNYQNNKASQVSSNAINSIQTEIAESTETTDLGNVTTEDGKPVLEFSKESGFYKDDIYVSIAATRDTTVYYTLDGSIPTKESEVYTDALVMTNISGNDNVLSAESDVSKNGSYVPSYDVDKGNIIRAIAVDKDGNSSDVVTAEYFINVGEKSEYNNIPIISIVSEPDDLMDYYRGIYRLGRTYEDTLASESDTENNANYLTNNSVDTLVKVYDSEHKSDYEVDGKLSIYKDSAIDNTQKSLLITTEDEKLLLSNMESDYGLKIRQNTVNAFFENANMVTVDYEPYMVFIDGEFWGLYQQVNDFTPEYIAGKTGKQASDILTSVNGKVNDKSKQEVFDDLYNFVTSNNLSKKENYKKLCNMMDVDSYITYIAANVYLANSDSEIINYCWYAKDEKKWYWSLGDMRGGLGANSLSTYSIDTYLRPAIAQNGFLNHLMQSDEFRDKFEKEILNMHDNYFSETQVEKVIDEINSSYAKAVASSYSRFCGAVTVDSIKPSIEFWGEFLEERASYIDVYTEEYMSDLKEDN